MFNILFKKIIMQINVEIFRLIYSTKIHNISWEHVNKFEINMKNLKILMQFKNNCKHF